MFPSLTHIPAPKSLSAHPAPQRVIIRAMRFSANISAAQLQHPELRALGLSAQVATQADVAALARFYIANYDDFRTRMAGNRDYPSVLNELARSNRAMSLLSLPGVRRIATYILSELDNLTSVERFSNSSIEKLFTKILSMPEPKGLIIIKDNQDQIVAMELITPFRINGSSWDIFNRSSLDDVFENRFGFISTLMIDRRYRNGKIARIMHALSEDYAKNQLNFNVLLADPFTKMKAAYLRAGQFTPVTIQHSPFSTREQTELVMSRYNVHSKTLIWKPL
jgi:hypothetical protein